MDERQIGLVLALKELGVDGDVSGFDARLILQKTIYLIEEAGIRLSYPFNWYLRGPYSPALARDLFDLASSDEDIDGWVLDDHSRAVAQRIKPLISDPPDEDADVKASRLELLASLHYLAHRRGVSLDDAGEATAQLARNGKHFSKAEVAFAIQALRNVELL